MRRLALPAPFFWYRWSGVPSRLVIGVGAIPAGYVGHTGRRANLSTQHYLAGQEQDGTSSFMVSDDVGKTLSRSSR